MLESLKSYVESHESLSVTNFHNSQGDHFIQEECNKLIKPFVPPGMPSAKTWTKVSKKATPFKELKESICETISGKKLRYKRHLNEITMMCRDFRSKNLVSHSFSSAELVSIDGVTLDHDLTNIKYNAAENYSNYKEKTQCHLGVISKCQYLLPLKNGKITVKLKIKKS